MATAERGDGTGRWRSLLAWAGVAGWGTWAAVRLAGGDRIPGVEVYAAPLLALTPYVAAATPVPVAVALILRRRWAAIAAGAVALALVAPVVPRALGGGGPDARGPVLRVLSANLYFGQADAGELLDLVRRTGADVLSVQELEPEAVQRYERAGLTRLLPYSVVDARPGAAGSGLFSRHPLRSLPEITGTRTATPQAELTLPDGRRVQVTAVHPVPPLASDAHRSWKRDIGRLPSAEPSGPIRILAGDFNATLDHAVLRRLIGRGYADAADRAGAGFVPTWGTARRGPPLTIDHVLADERCGVTGFEVHDLAGTDHRAVLAKIRLP
jgi:endonuclease/exonuclease/phosphatase (EEP) superfamily protein YafD